MSWSEMWDSVKAVVFQQESAGVAGSILAFLNSPGRRYLERAFNLLSGIACVLYVTPAIIEKLSVATNGGKLCTAFLVGLLGMRLTSKVLYLVAGMRPAEVRAYLLKQARSILGEK